MPNTSTPSVLIISDPPHAEELATHLRSPLFFGRDFHASSGATPSQLGVSNIEPHPHAPGSAANAGGAGTIDVMVSDGGEAARALFLARGPDVVVIDASLQGTDAKSMMATLRASGARATAFVLVGDEHGTVRRAIDAVEFAPDRFVPRPLSPEALRAAVREAFEDVAQRKSAARVGTDSRAPWEAHGDAPSDDSAADLVPEKDDPGALPLPPLFEIRPRKEHQPMAEIPAWGEGAPPLGARSRESSLVIRAPDPDPPAMQSGTPGPRMRNPSNPPPIPAIRSRGISGLPFRGGTSSQPTVTVEDEWSEPTPLIEVVERNDHPAMSEELPSVDALDGLDPDPRMVGASPMYDVGEFDDPDLIVPTPVPARAVQEESGSGQDFARQLRAKMSLMAQRLFHRDPVSAERGDDELRGNGHREHDLAALGIDRQLDRVGVTAIARVSVEHRGRTAPTASPRSWNFQIDEREFSDSGELLRGVSDAAVVFAKLFARRTTGRVAFRQDEIEKVVFVDAGRPVFASSNAPGDRMGELLVREGKITAAQYDRCQADVTRSGRRIGEILVDFGYLKRRELLPAVRRHVEDIVFSLFGWTRGHYQITSEAAASGERIRMSRHPASLVLEGIRRKLDRSTLEQLVGPPSTVIEVSSRERLGAIVSASDLVEEERAALAAFDGRADLTAVARTAGVDIADVLPLAWGLCVLELATARRIETDDSSAGLVGETDLAIDRERIRARWNLVAEADYFALLGVRRDATGFEIRRAYQSARRDFAAENFPMDLQRELSHELADIATVLDEAYRVMRDDRLRVMYLSHLSKHTEAH